MVAMNDELARAVITPRTKAKYSNHQRHCIFDPTASGWCKPQFVFNPGLTRLLARIPACLICALHNTVAGMKVPRFESFPQGIQ